MEVKGRIVELVLATNNAGKVAEIERLLQDLLLLVVSVERLLGRRFEVDETGSTFAENAELKARAACQATGMLSLADDSGLEVDALGGRPGVRSARFAGEAASDEENNERLLAELALVPNPERTARFRCVMALAVPGGDVHHVAGSSEGVILQAPRGSGGFGYDPLFAVPELGGSSFAELSAAQKDAVSHRGKALTKLRVLLLNQLSSQ